MTTQPPSRHSGFGVAHAYTRRETGSYGGADHIITPAPSA